MSRDAICRREVSAGRAFVFVIIALLFAASAVVTIAWCASMSAMGEVPMPGGWSMSMAWMPMCGQSWPQAAASFLGMWMVMMAAMMLPSLAPALWRYRQSVGGMKAPRLGLLTGLVGGGYFAVWLVLGMAVFVAGATLAAALTQLPALAHAVPLAGGAIVVIAGALQFTAWKARHLACCRDERRCSNVTTADANAAWRHGMSLGLHCACSCAGPTAVLLVGGVMDLRVMVAVTAAITAERLAPDGERVAQATGAVAIAAGLLLVGRAAGFTS